MNSRPAPGGRGRPGRVARLSHVVEPAQHAPPSAAAVLSVKDLLARRGATTILRGLDWTVRPGEHWVILGPNGCGKTSLLAALTGYLTPTAGEVTVLGSTYGRADWRDLRTHVGFVSNALTRRIEPDETALQVVASGPSAVLNLWRPPGARERAAALRLLHTWRATALADRPWGVLSQGERQRALIARALLARPALLLLDEPCAGLDPVARERLLALVERQAARRRGPAIVLITHHVEEITPAFTHVLILRRGRVLAAGPIASTLTSKNLAAAFGVPVQLSRRHGRWTLSMQ
jgi:iron complex transport system ATP-binding protein